MLVSSSRAMGHITPAASSPDSHHLPADLSPRSSNSSLVSSNESPSGSSPRMRENSSSPRSGREDGISALQCLENALGRSPFTLFQDSEPENEQLQQQIHKTFAILASPNGGGRPRIRSDSGDSHDEEMRDNKSPHNHNQHLAVRTPNGSPTSTSGSSSGVLGSTIFQCPLCHVVYNSRHDFNEHIVTHSQQHACPKCTYITNEEDELHHHVQDVHGVQDYMDMFSDDEVRTPKTNAQGKLKTFKCKHCEYRADTKKAFWDHTKSHIRQEKMLHCPKCPFVTEYKHHLEYHLRNHMGSKPYQCTKCAYSCVNKSMLNSHLKSHSNIYQYRCSDCSYATKYCHSLKLHLRKYSHSPAMVLNPDGTPNPLPIIDVYGTRRGPKMKRPDPILEGLATTQPLLPSSPTSNAFLNTQPKPQKSQKKSTPVKKDKSEKHRHQQQQLDGRDLSPKPASPPRFISSMPNSSGTPPLKKMREDSSGDSDNDTRIPSQLAGRATQLPQAPISPSSIAMILQRSNNDSFQQQKEMNVFPPQASGPNPLELYNVAQYLLNPMLQMHGLNGFAQQMASDQKATLLAHLLHQKMAPSQPMQMPQQEITIDYNDSSKRNVAPSPLDLRNPRNDMPLFGTRPGNGMEESKKRKRKGKALRYERPSSSDNDDEDDDDEALDFSNNNNNNNNSIHYKVQDARSRHDGPTDLSVNVGNLLCKYCQISFPDRELYTIHMNFHSGGEDPFLCRCGKRTQNKIDFFKHLTTDPH